MNKLSIIVPVYNVEPYLEKCVESIINQSFIDWEMYLIDDGSLDSCSEFCDTYALKDSRIKVIHKTNKGVSAARNAGIELFDSEWVTFVDSDDFLLSDAYEKTIQSAEKNDCDIAIMDFAYVDGDGNVVKNREYPYGEDELLSKMDMLEKQFDIPLSIRLVMWNKIFKSDVIKGLKYDESLKASEDTLLLFECLKNANKGVWIRQPLYQNVQRQGSAMHGALHLKDYAESLKIHEKIYKDTKSQFPNLADKALIYYIDTCVWKMRSQKSSVFDLRGKEYKKANKLLSWMKHRILKEWYSILVCKEMSLKQKIEYLKIGVIG